jgi:hypothetical protein
MASGETGVRSLAAYSHTRPAGRCWSDSEVSVMSAIAAVSRSRPLLRRYDFADGARTNSRLDLEEEPIGKPSLGADHVRPEDRRLDRIGLEVNETFHFASARPPHSVFHLRLCPAVGRRCRSRCPQKESCW